MDRIAIAIGLEHLLALKLLLNASADSLTLVQTVDSVKPDTRKTKSLESAFPARNAKNLEEMKTAVEKDHVSREETLLCVTATLDSPMMD